MHKSPGIGGIENEKDHIQEELSHAEVEKQQRLKAEFGEMHNKVLSLIRGEQGPEAFQILEVFKKLDQGEKMRSFEMIVSPEVLNSVKDQIYFRSHANFKDQQGGTLEIYRKFNSSEPDSIQYIHSDGSKEVMNDDHSYSAYEKFLGIKEKFVSGFGETMLGRIIQFSDNKVSFDFSKSPSNEFAREMIGKFIVKFNNDIHDVEYAAPVDISFRESDFVVNNH